MDYQEKQFKLFEELENKFRSDMNAAEIVEPVSDYISDNRMCLTGVAFASGIIIEAIQSNIVAELKEIDNRQYYYLPESLHITIQNIRTIKNPPLFTEDDIKKAADIFQETIPLHNKITFTFKGIFETPTSFSGRGYCGDELRKLIFDLKKKLTEAGVPDNKKYSSDEVFFGNITVCRYTTKPNEDFFDKIKELKNVEIGVQTVDKVSLITTNAVAYPEKTKIIGNYYFK